jgi:hypothetical protein
MFPSFFDPEEIFGNTLFREKMANISSSVDAHFGIDAVHLQNWKKGEEINLTFLSENPSFTRKLVIEKKACYGSGLKRIQMPTRIEISRSSFAFSFLLIDVVFQPFSELYCIADKAFYSCIGLQRFFIPNSVRFIGCECFTHCINLNTIEIERGSNLCGIERGAFSFSGLKSISIPESVEYLGDFCLNESYSLSTICIEGKSRMKAIGIKCFRWTNIESFDIPESVETIGEKAFDHCHFLVDVNFGGCSQLEKVTKSCFRFCRSLSEIRFESNSMLKCIETEAFSSSSLTNIFIPRSVETLGAKCFCSCKSLHEVIFESDSLLKFIESSTFSSSSLKNIGCPTPGEQFMPTM